MDKAYYQAVRNLVKAALVEDIGKGDLTSLACLQPEPIKARITAKSAGVLSGIEPALMAFNIVDSGNTVRPLKKDSEPFAAGDVVMEIEGFNQTVLTTERTALNFLAHLSGIATFTNRFVKKIEGTPCRILDTRKTTPGWRYLEKAAVVHGGGHNHRYGLYDMILVKDNHIAAAGSIGRAVEMTREFLRTAQFRQQFNAREEDIEIEVEVTAEEEVTRAIKAGITRLLLDNQSVESLKKLVALSRKLDPAVQLEASGNVTLDNVADIAATGVDFISIGAITHSAEAADFSLGVTK
ncbi:MAG: carboxylating nicotinate-nucleotide diphosphorylase [Candidatus Zixiibacteriota bacterium]|nr:MAG: carboxylating nicotinate-nucleotide diphosphorylase [candidate division Zixibacteria bacterium]